METTNTNSSLRDYGLAMPHGPNPTGEHVATQDIGVMNPNERDIFNHLILPEDSYNSEGTYWADMPLGKRFAFVSKTDSAEARKELGQIGRMMKKDPLSPIGWCDFPRSISLLNNINKNTGILETLLFLVLVFCLKGEFLLILVTLGTV